MSKTPKTDALRAMREQSFEHSILERRGNMKHIAKQALAKAEAKSRKAKRRK